MNELENARYEEPIQVDVLVKRRFSPEQMLHNQELLEAENRESEKLIIPVVAGKSVPIETLHALVSHKELP